MLAEVISGTLVEVITSTGRWLAVEAAASRGRQSKEDAEIAEWFDTYKLSDSDEPQLPDLPQGLTPTDIREALESNAIQANLHELLAARLTDAPELVIDRVREIFSTTLEVSLGKHADGEISNSLFNYYDIRICELVGRLEGGQPALFRRIRQDAFSTRIVAVLNSIESHLATLRDVEHANSREEERFLGNYRRHVIDLHGKLQPPDFDRRQRIPIADLYVSPNITKMPGIPSKGPTGSSGRRRGQLLEFDLGQAGEPIIRTIPQLAGKIDRTVLLGDPGGGKSTASSVLMHELASSPNGRIPFLVVLRDFASASPPPHSIVRHIEQRLEGLYQCPAPRDLIRRLLTLGSALIIFDGLDELIDTTRRIEITEIVEQFGIEYPLAPILVTSRLVGYDQARLDDHQYVCYRLSGFDQAQVQDYVRKWFDRDLTVEMAERARWARSFMQESVNVPDLRSNPLMLALMCILYHGEGSIPRNRPEVYQQCAEMLFRKWDARRQINVELRARYLIEPALRHLAYWLFTGADSDSSVTERELVRETADFFYERGFDTREEASDAATEFIQFCRGRAWVFSDAGTTANGETLYTFTHRTFLEYFAAAYLATVNDSPEDLAQVILSRVAKEEWVVVAELAVQKKDQISDLGAERIIIAMLEDRRRRAASSRGNILKFLASCARFVEVSPRATRQLVHSILAHWEMGDPNDSIFFDPLAALLLIAPGRRDLVRGEIQSWAHGKIHSDDHDMAVNVLLLISYLYDGVFLAELESNLEDNQNSELMRYWQDASAASVSFYEAELKAEMQSNVAVMRLGLSYHLTNLKEILSWDNDRLSILFQSIPIGVFGVSWGPYLQWCVDMILRRDVDQGSMVEAFRALGQYLVEHPTTPWYDSETAAPLFETDALDNEGIPDTSHLLGQKGYLGLVAVICIASERRRGDGLGQQVPRIGAYIARRYGQLELPGLEELPDLPVPKSFRMIFKDWARGEINFTAD